MDDDPIFKFHESRLEAAHRWQKRALEAEARVAELEAEKLALDTCWRCKVTLEKVGSHESRVPRCTECPEPESMDDVDQSGEGGG